jgi:cytoskeletal protein CcmA (bactofilin family)
MWNREEAQNTPHQNDGPKSPAVVQPPPSVAAQPNVSIPAGRAVATTGASLVLKGELTASEDLVIEGRVEGKISLPGHLLTIGSQANISADVAAKAVIIHGNIVGNVAASERFEIKTGGRMTGDLVSPKVVMAEGSEFRGRVDMSRAGEPRTEHKKQVRPEPVAAIREGVASARPN